MYWGDWVLVVFGLIVVLTGAAYLKIRSVENRFETSPPKATNPKTFASDLLAAYKASGAPPIIPSYLTQLLGVFQQLHGAKPPTTSAAYALCLKACSESLIGFANHAPKILIEQPASRSPFTQVRDAHLEIFNGATGALADPAFETGAYAAYRALAAPFKDKNSPTLRDAGLFDWDYLMHEIHYSVDVREPGNFSDEMGVTWLEADQATRRDWERRNEKYHNADSKAWAERELKGYKTPNWMTYQQALTLGAQVRKGEKATTVVFTKQLNVKDKETEEEKKVGMLRTYAVFNEDQIDGLPTIELTQVNPELPLNETVERFIAATHADIRLGGNKACYIPSQDFIALPHKHQFRGLEHFYATALHELSHFTGHETRLNRDLKNRFGTKAYAAEELVAELSAAFLCAHLGITGELRHAEYIANWITLLKEDQRAIFTAASLASKASDYLRQFSEPVAQAAE